MFFKGSASRDGGKVLIAPRTSRWVNHSCLPNAGIIYDEETRVEILFAQQEIQPGEEVIVCYYTHFKNLGPSTMSDSDDEDQSTASPFEDDVAALQAIMKKDWGFTCPKDRSVGIARLGSLSLRENNSSMKCTFPPLSAALRML